MKNIACHISKQRVLQPSSHHITASLMVSPEGTQDGNMMPTIYQSTAAATPVVYPEKTQDEKAQDTGPR